MNRHLLREWTSRVRSDDTIICLGDIALPDAWDDRRLVLEIRNCPDERVLILGNRVALRAAGFTTQYPLAVCATDPPLVLSHYPLHHLPVGAPALSSRVAAKWRNRCAWMRPRPARWEAAPTICVTPVEPSGAKERTDGRRRCDPVRGLGAGEGTR